jgi:hypothetical protein
MNAKDFQQTNQTNHWLKTNGINVAHIYAGTSELFQAQKLATQALTQYREILKCEHTITLNNFLQATRNLKKRIKITQGQCFKIMNIVKQAQRTHAKSNKA